MRARLTSTVSKTPSWVTSSLTARALSATWLGSKAAQDTDGMRTRRDRSAMAAGIPSCTALLQGGE